MDRGGGQLCADLDWRQELVAVLDNGVKIHVSGRRRAAFAAAVRSLGR